MFILEPGMWSRWRKMTCDQVEGQIPSSISNWHAESVNNDFGKLTAKDACQYINLPYKPWALEVNGSVGEGLDGATQMALIRMKRGWWGKDLWDSQHTHGFPPEKRQQVQAPLSTGFSSLGNSLPLLKFGHNERLLFDQLECIFPLLLYGQPKASQMSFVDSCFTSFLGENSVKWRLLPSMLWGPCAKLFCPDLWDPAICFSLSIRLNRVKLCSATHSHRAGLRPTSSFSHAT